MEFKEFEKLMECKTQLYLGNEFEVSVRKVIKNNNVEHTGIMAKGRDSNMFPTIYIDDYYEPEMKENDVEYAAKKLADSLLNASNPEEFDVDSFLLFESARKNIVFKLINAETNKELLFGIPYRRFHNLAIVYSFVLNNDKDDSSATILIRNEHIEKWETTEEELFDIAYNNTLVLMPSKIMNIRNVINELYGRDIIETEINMYVVTNIKKSFGANILIFEEELSHIAEMLGVNYYILPSSVHEFIVVPESEESDPLVFLQMVTQINHTELMPEEILADSLYYYDVEQGILEWVG